MTSVLSHSPPSLWHRPGELSAQPLLDDIPFGVIDYIMNVLHEMTIAVSVEICYIDLLHQDSLLLPPRESNMFLNFCTGLYVF